LRHLLGFTEHFAAGCLKKTGTQSRFADCFQDPDRADAGDVGSVFRNVEVTRTWLCGPDDKFRPASIRKEASQDYRVAEVAVPETAHTVYVISVKMINTRGVERIGAANDSVDFSPSEQQIRQITSVLARNAGDRLFMRSVLL
jgi:hypothetical protein